MTFGRNQANLSASFLDDGIGRHCRPMGQQPGLATKRFECHAQCAGTCTKCTDHAS